MGGQHASGAWRPFTPCYCEERTIPHADSHHSASRVSRPAGIEDPSRMRRAASGGVRAGQSARGDGGVPAATSASGVEEVLTIIGGFRANHSSADALSSPGCRPSCARFPLRLRPVSGDS